MSLAQHVSSIEGPDRLELPNGIEADDDDFNHPLIVPRASHKAVRRVISYDAFPPPHEDEVHHVNAVSAYKFSTTYRAGIIYQYALGFKAR